MKTILVSGASGILGYGILKSLQRSSNLYKLIGTSIYDDSIAPVFCDIFEKAVRTDSEDYMDWLLGVIEKHEVDMIIPGIECDMYKWDEERDILFDHTYPLLNSPGLISSCYNKWNFYLEMIKQNSCYAIPTSKDAPWKPDYPFPLILKPRRGFGSQGIIRVRSMVELQKLGAVTEMIVQPIIGTDEEEYTTAAFFDRFSNLIDHITFKRKLSKQGWTEIAEVSDIDCEKMLIDLALIFKPVGPTNFQFRIDNGIKLLEINPRISASTSIRASLGYNEAAMSIEYFLNGKVPERTPKPIGKKAIRYTEDYIF